MTNAGTRTLNRNCRDRVIDLFGERFGGKDSNSGEREL